MPVIKMLLGSGKAMLFIAIVIAGGLVFYHFDSIKRDLADAKAEVVLRDRAIEDMGVQAEYLAQSVRFSEQANAKLLKERESLAKINKQNKQALNELSVQYHLAQSQIANLRTSSDDTIKTWANDCIPNNAISLLKYAKPEACKGSRAD